MIQPRWAEPSLESLSNQMLKAYKDPVLLKEKSKLGKEIAKQYSWDLIGDKIYKRFLHLAKQLNIKLFLEN